IRTGPEPSRLRRELSRAWSPSIFEPGPVMSVSSSEPGGDGWLRLGGVVELVVEQVLGDSRVSVCGAVRQVEDHGQVQRVWPDGQGLVKDPVPAHAVSYTHLRAHETPEHLVCRLLLDK